MDGLPTGPLVELVKSTGAIGAILIAVIIALALAVIVFARTANLFASTATGVQATEFQRNLVDLVGKLSANEAALRGEVGALQRENAGLRDQIAAMTVSVDLLRVQQRRLMDMLRAVMDGRMPPQAIRPSDIEGAG